MNDESQIPILRELTDRLTRGINLMNNGEGVCVLSGLYNVPGCGALCVFLMPVGTLKLHQHFEVEHLIIESGVLEIEKNGDKTVITRGEHIRIDPSTPHTARAITRVVGYGITVPPAEGYPDGP